MLTFGECEHIERENGSPFYVFDRDAFVDEQQNHLRLRGEVSHDSALGVSRSLREHPDRHSFDAFSR